MDPTEALGARRTRHSAGRSGRSRFRVLLFRRSADRLLHERRRRGSDGRDAYSGTDLLSICRRDADLLCQRFARNGFVKPMALIALVSYLCIGIPVGYLLGFVFDWKLNGLFLGLPAGLFTAAALFFYYFRKAMKRNLQAPEGGA